MLRKLVSSKFVLLLARTIDYRIGTNDSDTPDKIGRAHV